jgi:hypothetical protein
MLGYGFLQHLSDARSQSDRDLVSKVVSHSLRAVGMLSDMPSLDHRQANCDSLPQLRWYRSQAGLVRG